MIMKLNVSNELKSRLVHAAENGSVIAKDILSEVKKNVPVEEIIRGTYNCFSTKRKRTEAGTFKKIRIVFTACSKDLAHPSFPDRLQYGRRPLGYNRSGIAASRWHTQQTVPDVGAYRKAQERCRPLPHIRQGMEIHGTRSSVRKVHHKRMDEIHHRVSAGY